MTNIEYIESTGVQYINTLYSPNTDTKIQANVMVLSGNTSNYPGIFGSRPSSAYFSNAIMLLPYHRGYSGYPAAYVFGSETSESDLGIAMPLDVELSIICQNGHVEWQGEGVTSFSKDITEASFSSTIPLYLFCIDMNNSPQSNTWCKMRLHSFDIYENDVLVKSFIPVKDDNDVACLYDTVGSQYYYNAGSSVFTPGPEIVPPGSGISVTIQRNNSEPISLIKDLTNIITASVYLKDGTSIIDPIFLLEAPLASIANANYITVPAFNRKYFIQDIISVTSDLVELHCHVDVLSSFADEIRANTGIIRRNEKEWNLYLNDGTLVSYSNPIVSTQEFPNGFTDQSYVLVVAGGRGGGVSTGEGGSIAVTGTESEEMGGNGNNNSKTTGGLVYYAYQQLGKPYWFGTFGNLATQSLLDYKRQQYNSYYPTPGNPDFSTQLGERVHDCVGLIKGYRWREDATMSDPVYNASQDVDVAGLYNQCIRYRGTVDPADTTATYPIGCVLFNSDFTHCGVYIGGGELIEARGHFYGVVQNTLASRPNFAYWGIPDWMQISEDYG